MRKDEKIYMDGLNFGDYFFNTIDHWDLNYLIYKVNYFISILTRNGYKLEVFMDGNNVSPECNEVYKKRVEERILKMEYKWPHACGILLANAFSENNIPVHWSVDADNDDTIATYAFMDGAAILSRDKDFLCYFADLKIFSKFEIDEKRNLVYFTRQTKMTKDHKFHWKLREIKRKILTKKPKTESNYSMISFLGLEKNYLLGGYPNAIPYFSINPYKIINELRKALYFAWGLKEIVKEEFPEYNKETKTIEWTIQEIDPLSYDPLFLELLGNPEKALVYFEDNYRFDKNEFKFTKAQWNNYLNGFFSSILKLNCFYNNQSLMRILLKFKDLAIDYLNKMF